MTMTSMLGYLAGFLTTISFIPQVIKTWKTRSTADLSLGMFFVFGVGVLIWLIYGIFLGEFPIILWNSVSLILVLIILVMKLKFEK